MSHVLVWDVKTVPDWCVRNKGRGPATQVEVTAPTAIHPRPVVCLVDNGCTPLFRRHDLAAA
jgi:hypothetical protein